jgi:hypothetical protein
MILAAAILLAQLPKGQTQSARGKPYILDITQGKGRVIYFGFRHSRDPKDPQFKTLRKLWLSEKPNLILNEDITVTARGSLEQSIKFDGERGALGFWAKQDKIPIRSIDMTWAEEIRKLPIMLPGPTIKMFYFIRGLQQDLQRPGAKKGAPATDRIAQSQLDMIQKQGIGWAPHTVADIGPIWRGLGIAGDWRKPKIEWVAPTGNGPLNKISAMLNAKRDEHMVQVLTQEMKNAKRVFAVVGATHVFMQQLSLPGKITKLP